ncbi:MAG: glycosyltransferase family 9 protein [Candidatus Pseudobacter hemicellulosilyticus]|uniref:Glycosyltransferase family 9 protein n=1 Tax=Candidatus Pseudobacter hemicellulosilyticus TaxID=3121375 RepID=A0AAJ5WSX1_9BACT|nr:MAG: glycosyltransferase family 9 protein [Pseudobacter sp.]
MKPLPRNIIISRTDSIGDVVLTLPVAAVLKAHFPDCRIGFLGKAYTRPVIEACTYVDTFIDVDSFLKEEVLMAGERPDAIIHVFPLPAIARRARQLGIPLRIGTTNRLYHWFTCNRLVKLSRKKSDLHEAQLNLVLLRPFGIDKQYSLPELGVLTGLEKTVPLPAALQQLLRPDRYNLVLHPKSQGSAREWPMEHYAALVRLLDPARYNIFVSGTAKEGALLQPLLQELGTAVTDITGQMDLYQFMAFIRAADGLLACSTGPLHLAAAMGKDAFGIYPPVRPIHPGRWAPIGSSIKVFVADQPCENCGNKGAECHCMRAISPEAVQEAIDQQQLKKES